MKDPKGMTDGYAVRLEQRRDGWAAMAAKMTVKLVRYVRKRPDGASRPVKMAFLCTAQASSYPGRIKPCRTQDFLIVGGHTCAVGVVPDYPEAWKPCSGTEARV